MATITQIEIPTKVEDITPSVMKEEIVKVETPKTKKLIKCVNADGTIDVSKLSATDLERYHKMGQSLKTSDINSISNFGSDTQQVMGSITSAYLKGSTTSQLGDELGQMYSEFAKKLKKLDFGDAESITLSKAEKFISKIPILRSFVRTLDDILEDYKDVKKDSDLIAKKIKASKLVSERDNNAMQRLKEQSVEYTQKMEDIIISGKLRIAELEQEIEQMRNSDEYDDYDIDEIEKFKERLETRIGNLVGIHASMKQLKPQIGILQHTNASLADNAEMIITQAMPLIEAQMALAININNQKNSLEAQKMTKEYIRQLMVTNSELLKKQSIDATKMLQEGFIDASTIQKTSENLVQTLQETSKIYLEYKAKRQEEEAIIRNIDATLADNIKNITELSSQPSIGGYLN